MPAPSSTRLYLLRHAHSSWALPGQRDHMRPLDERGRREAPRIGAEMKRLGFRIDVVVSSTALRAQETLAAVRPFLRPDVAEHLSDDLYALGTEAYLAAARAEDVAAAMLVGHNPMIEEFAASIVGGGDEEAVETLKRGFPTAGLAVIEFETPLARIEPGAGYLRSLLHPKAL